MMTLALISNGRRLWLRCWSAVLVFSGHAGISLTLKCFTVAAVITTGDFRLYRDDFRSKISHLGYSEPMMNYAALTNFSSLFHCWRALNWPLCTGIVNVPQTPRV